jgi:YesN/AraC family two-component response regulator
VAELAGISEMSPYYFGKLFKQSTGLTVHEYVTKRRVQPAIDGKRFLMNVLAEEQERTSFRVVLNWPALLKR